MKNNAAHTVLLLLLTAGCTNRSTQTHQADAACIHSLVFDSAVASGLGSGTGAANFIRAVHACGDPVPDLTGDTLLQGMAIMYGYQFKINFAEDTRLKLKHRGDIIPTGSLIPVNMIFTQEKSDGGKPLGAPASP